MGFVGREVGKAVFGRQALFLKIFRHLRSFLRKKSARMQSTLTRMRN